MRKWVLAALVCFAALAAAANVNACFGAYCDGYYYDGYYYRHPPGFYYVPYGGCACWGYGCGYGCGGAYYGGYSGYGGYGYSYSYSYSYNYGYGYGAPRYRASTPIDYYCANGWC